MSHPIFRIAIGADHGAVDLKNAVTEHLKAVGHEVRDYGTQGHESVDYADYANLVSRNVADGTYDFGFLCCTSGVGMSIAANRHRHVRAANVRTVEETIITRQHNDSNILCLAGKTTDIATGIAMADAFTPRPLKVAVTQAAFANLPAAASRKPTLRFTRRSPPRSIASGTTSSSSLRKISPRPL